MPRYRCVIWLEIEETLRKADLAEAVADAGEVPLSGPLCKARRTAAIRPWCLGPQTAHLKKSFTAAKVCKWETNKLDSKITAQIAVRLEARI
ncbi:hypothetical protein GCM10022404_03080 [Celeribacter arenosi]|uniref:Transposase n=1 Tax=Celeribacter arenosi TaxID=792649 RepID=A0ABP7JVF1_9RHOB